jgi:hypothetical protein
MKFKLLTLFSIILALVIKTYSLSARDGVIDDEEVELLAQWELKNADDSLRHQKHVGILATELAESKQITEEFTGAGAMVKCKTYHHYARLRTAANEFELNELMKHESPIIRVYAHRALMEKHFDADKDLVAAIAADSTEIEWLNGDVLVHTTVMDMVSSNMFLIDEPDTLMAFTNF